MDLLIRIAINAVALVVAAKVVPNIHLTIGRAGEQWIKIAVLALIFGLVNSYLKPIVKSVALPINYMTLGLVGVVINAAMLLLTAWVADALKLGLGFRIGVFPPNFDVTTIVAAILGAIVISIVATILSMVLGQRKILGFRV
ncbi:MAG: phage holin family protein [Candidatus Limnocylindrales bacterium]